MTWNTKDRLLYWTDNKDHEYIRNATPFGPRAAKPMTRPTNTTTTSTLSPKGRAWVAGHRWLRLARKNHGPNMILYNEFLPLGQRSSARSSQQDGQVTARLLRRGVCKCLVNVTLSVCDTLFGAHDTLGTTATSMYQEAMAGQFGHGPIVAHGIRTCLSEAAMDTYNTMVTKCQAFSLAAVTASICSPWRWAKQLVLTLHGSF